MPMFDRFSRAVRAALQAWGNPPPPNSEAANDAPWAAPRVNKLPAGFRRKVRAKKPQLPKYFSPPEDFATFYVYCVDWSVLPVKDPQYPSDAVHYFFAEVSKAKMEMLNYTAICFTQAAINARVIWYLAKRDCEKYRNLPHPDMAHGLSYNMYLIGEDHIPFVGAREWGVHEWMLAGRMKLTHPWFKHVETVHLTPELALAMGDKEAARVLAAGTKPVESEL